MYYLFLNKQEDIDKYKAELARTLLSIEHGKTPVFNETRNAKTSFIESIPYNAISGVLMICGALLINLIKANEIVKIAIVMIINSFCHQIANYVFVFVKHKLRIRLCKKMDVEPTERIIAAMESLEYQSV